MMNTHTHTHTHTHTYFMPWLDIQDKGWNHADCLLPANVTLNNNNNND